VERTNANRGKRIDAFHAPYKKANPMSENRSELAEVRARLERMERALQRWKQGTALLVLGLAACAVLGGAATEGPPKEFQVQTLRIVDRGGKDRIVLTADPSSPDLTFLDPSGKSRLTLDLAADQRPVVQFSDTGEEKGRLTLGMEDGAPLLQLYDHAGRKRVVFGVPKEHGPVLRILDDNERTQMRFP
jgi:hypothetical protein